MKPFTKVQAIKIATDFQKYIGYTTPVYIVIDVIVAPADPKESIKFMLEYRKRKTVVMDGDEADVVVSIRTNNHNEMDIPIREFVKNHKIDYTFPV